MSNSIRLNRELALGKRKLGALFADTLQVHTAGELLKSDEIYHVRMGWACQFRDLANGRPAIVDVYLPGDVIGLDTVLHARPLHEVLTLTAVTLGAVAAEDVVMDLMAYRPTALYLAWLLSQRQRRIERLFAAVSCLDAPGRLAVMILDFYDRLRRRRLITGSTYSLPLSHVQIGHYLGLTVVHISRVLRSLREARIVCLERHCVTILDLERLTSLAQTGGSPDSSTARVEGRLPAEIALARNDARSETRPGTAGS